MEGTSRSRAKEVFARGRSGGKVSRCGVGSPRHPPPELLESRLPLGLLCTGGQGAPARFWHVCPHRQGMSF